MIKKIRLQFEKQYAKTFGVLTQEAKQQLSRGFLIFGLGLILVGLGLMSYSPYFGVTIPFGLGMIFTIPILLR